MQLDISYPNVPPLGKSEHERQVEKQVKALLKEHKYVVFERPYRLSETGMVSIKVIDRWEPDDLGDLTAVWTHNASTKYICPADPAYKIRGIDSLEEFRCAHTS